MGTFVDVVTARALATTTKVRLSGDKSGNSAPYVNNERSKAILAVQPYIAAHLTAAQTVIAKLHVESDDLGLKNYQVFAPPIQGGLGATVPALSDPMSSGAYPLNVKTEGGERIDFSGEALVTNTVEPLMGCLVYWSDQPPRDKVLKAQVTDETSTGTAAATVAGPSITITGKVERRIKAIVGILTNLVQTATDRGIGYFHLGGDEIEADQYFPAEPIQGFLGATGNSAARLAYIKNLNVKVTTPATITTELVLEEALTSAGNFVLGILYE